MLQKVQKHAETPEIKRAFGQWQWLWQANKEGRTKNIDKHENNKQPNVTTQYPNGYKHNTSEIYKINSYTINIKETTLQRLTRSRLTERIRPANYRRAQHTPTESQKEKEKLFFFVLS